MKKYNLITGDKEPLQGCLVKVLEHPLLLLLQPPLRLLHVLRHRVLPQELHGLADVEALGVLQELVLETLLIHRQVLTPCRWIVLIQTQFDVAVLEYVDLLQVYIFLFFLSS